MDDFLEIILKLKAISLSRSHMDDEYPSGREAAQANQERADYPPETNEAPFGPEKYNEQIQTYEAGLQGQGKLDLAISQQETREDQQLDSARVQPDLRIRTMKNSQANKTT